MLLLLLSLLLVLLVLLLLRVLAFSYSSGVHVCDSTPPPPLTLSRVVERYFQVCVPICDGTEGSCPCDHLCLPKRFEMQGEPHTTEVYLCRPPDAGECSDGGSALARSRLFARSLCIGV